MRERNLTRYLCGTLNWQRWREMAVMIWHSYGTTEFTIPLQHPTSATHNLHQHHNAAREGGNYKHNTTIQSTQQTTPTSPQSESPGEFSSSELVVVSLSWIVSRIVVRRWIRRGTLWCNCCSIRLRARCTMMNDENQDVQMCTGVYVYEQCMFYQYKFLYALIVD